MLHNSKRDKSIEHFIALSALKCSHPVQPSFHHVGLVYTTAAEHMHVSLGSIFNHGICSW